MKTNLADGLYHTKTGLPPIPSEWFGTFGVNYTSHAARAFLDDKLFKPGFRAPKFVTVGEDPIVEVEVREGVVYKLVVRSRFEFARDLDLVLALVEPTRAPHGYFIVAKTVWFNRVLDPHSTLDISKYIPYR